MKYEEWNRWKKKKQFDMRIILIEWKIWIIYKLNGCMHVCVCVRVLPTLTYMQRIEISQDATNLSNMNNWFMYSVNRFVRWNFGLQTANYTYFVSIKKNLYYFRINYFWKHDLHQQWRLCGWIEVKRSSLPLLTL